MVNIATLNYLPELAQYEAQIPRLEDGWWPTGGAVNPATDSGLMNWQSSLLANRTSYLKKVIDDAGLGAAAVPLVTLNSAAARLTGSYRFASTDPNTPAAGVAGTVEVIAASAGAVNQVARDSATTRMWARIWNGAVWSAWSEIWRTTGVAESLAGNGWQRLPSGLIIQWGSYTTLGGTANVTFPLAFPTAIYRVLGSEAAASGWTGTSLTLHGIGSESITGFTARSFNWNGSAFVGSTAVGNFMAIGR